MAKLKLEIPVVADISEIESLIDEIKHLQTYKLSYGDEQILIDRDDVIKIFAAHVRANIEPERKKGKWIYNSPVTMKCDQCGFVIKDWDWHRFKFCPNCGCAMEGKEE